MRRCFAPQTQEFTMNWDIIEGRWTEMKGKVR